jgi:uncharacterized protein involved in oxidation of intracellular sulfur
MSTCIISGSRGTDDPTMATLPFMAAKVAKEQGHDVVPWLWNESVTLGRKGTAEHVTGVNLTPLKDLLAAVQAANIPIWVCGPCAVARQIGAGDLVSGATIKGMADYNHGRGRMRPQRDILIPQRRKESLYVSRW